MPGQIGETPPCDVCVIFSLETAKSLVRTSFGSEHRIFVHGFSDGHLTSTRKVDIRPRRHSYDTVQRVDCTSWRFVLAEILACNAR